MADKSTISESVDDKDRISTTDDSTSIDLSFHEQQATKMSEDLISSEANLVEATGSGSMRVPYRELEDSVIYKKERTIYETVIEYEQDKAEQQQNISCPIVIHNEDGQSISNDQGKYQAKQQTSNINLATSSSSYAAQVEHQQDIYAGYMNSNRSRSQSIARSEDSAMAGNGARPRFMALINENLKVVRKSRVELKTRIEPRDDPRINVEWFKDGQSIVSSNRISIYNNYGYVALIICGFDERDEGRYTCTITNDFGSDRTETVYKLDERYKQAEEDKRLKQEMIQRLLKLKQSMKMADQMETERKAQYAAKMKEQEQEKLERRRLAENARREAMAEERKRLVEQERVARARREAEAQLAYKSSLWLANRSPTSLGDSTSDYNNRGEWLRGDENYIIVPYRTLEDSIFLKKDREIYETVIEYGEDETEMMAEQERRSYRWQAQKASDRDWLNSRSAKPAVRMIDVNLSNELNASIASEADSRVNLLIDRGGSRIGVHIDQLPTSDPNYLNNYIRVPYRELEDSIIYKKEKTVYETVTEYESEQTEKEDSKIRLIDTITYDPPISPEPATIATSRAKNLSSDVKEVKLRLTEEHRQDVTSLEVDQVRSDKLVQHIVADLQLPQEERKTLALYDSNASKIAQSKLRTQIGLKQRRPADEFMEVRSMLKPVNKNPRFLAPIAENLRIIKRSRVELKTRIEPRNDRNLKVRWFRDGEEIFASNRETLYHNYGYVALIISGFDECDEGVYTCCINNEYGSAETRTVYRLDERYSQAKEEEKSKQEMIKKLVKIKESMRSVDEAEAERKAMHIKSMKLEEADEQDRLRSKVDVQHAGSLTAQEDITKAAAESREVVDLSRIKTKSEESRREQQVLSRQESTVDSLNGSRKASLAEENYIIVPYRTLEDSIFLTKEREIYETVKEFESSDDESISREISTISDKQRESQVKDQLAMSEKIYEDNEVDLMRMPSRLRGGDQMTGALISTATIHQSQQIETDQPTRSVDQSRRDSTISAKTEMIDSEAVKPRFLASIADNPNVTRKSRVELKTRIEPSDSSVQVQWFKNGLEVDASSRISFYNNYGYVALIIDGFDERDEGRYSCMISNDYGSDKIEARFKLDERYRRLEINRRLNEEAASKLAKIRESIKLAEKLEIERKARYASQLKQQELEEEARKRRAELIRLNARMEARRIARDDGMAARIKADAEIELRRSRSASRINRISRIISPIERPTVDYSDSGEGFIDEQSYIVVPYRELEDSIYLRKQREIYETVTEFEPDESAKKEANLGRVSIQWERTPMKDDFVSKVDDRQLDLPSTSSHWIPRRLRGGDTNLTAETRVPGTEDHRKLSMKSEITGPILSIVADGENDKNFRTSTYKDLVIPGAEESQIRISTTSATSEESDGFEEDSFIYTSLKISESPTLDRGIIEDLDKLNIEGFDKKEARRRVVLSEDDSDLTSTHNSGYQGR